MDNGHWTENSGSRPRSSINLVLPVSGEQAWRHSHSTAFELTKANLSGTDYKLHQQIRKYQTWCKAIQSVLKCYNQAAAALDPPHPWLEWQEVMQYYTLADFDLLWVAAQEDIWKYPWAKEINQQATIYKLHMEHAWEEIQRWNGGGTPPQLAIDWRGQLWAVYQ